MSYQCLTFRFCFESVDITYSSKSKFANRHNKKKSLSYATGEMMD